MVQADSPGGAGSQALVLGAYYLATPLFAALDLGAGVNLRLAGLAGHPGLRVAYYLLLLGCALVVWRYPRSAAPVGLLEGSLTVALLVLAVMLPIVELPTHLEDGGLAVARTTIGQAVANLLISGPPLAVSLYRNPLLRR